MVNPMTPEQILREKAKARARKLLSIAQEVNQIGDRLHELSREEGQLPRDYEEARDTLHQAHGQIKVLLGDAIWQARGEGSLNLTGG